MNNKQNNKTLSAELQKEFESFKKWLKENNYNPKDEKEVAELYKKYLNLKKKIALHGAKLNYIKSLKNQCAEDEELYYYKKGGSVGCGCKKKEDGGKVIESAQNGTVAKFKSRPTKWTDKDERKLDSLSAREAKKQPITPQGKKDLKNLRDKFKKSSNKKDYELEEGKKGMKVEKDCGGSAVTKFKAACGSKLKKHQLGGSLNGIPFYLEGTPKGGVLYRFRRSTNNMNNGYKTYSDLIMMTLDPLGYPTYDTPPISAGRTIYVTPLGNDTIFYTNNDILNKTPKGDLNLKKAKLKFYQLIKKAPIEGEEYRMTPYWNSNLFNLDMVRNRALKGN